MKIQFIVKAWITARQVIQFILLLERGGEQSHPIFQFDFAEFCWHQHGFNAGQYAEWSRQQNHSVNICARYVPNTRRVIPTDNQSIDSPTVATAQIPMRGQLNLEVLNLWNVKIKVFFFSSHTQIKDKSCHCCFSHLNNVTSTFLLSFFCCRDVATLLCVCWYVAIKPTVNLKKVCRHQTFTVEGESLRNDLLLLWVRN